MAQVVAELIFFLIAQHRERRNWCDELIISKRFIPGNCAGGRRERKREREAQFAGARFGAVEPAASLSVNDPSQEGLKL